MPPLPRPTTNLYSQRLFEYHRSKGSRSVDPAVEPVEPAVEPVVPAVELSAARQSVTANDPSPSFFARNQFLIYRLFSLAGLMPVGAFLAVHLLTNASVLAGPATFQARVDMIHSLGPLLVPIEWAFIFLPMIFHAVVGFVIIANGMPNVGSYAYVSNVRYTLQRATGMIAFVFIIWHVTQLHWLGTPFGGGRFDPHYATSSAAVVLRPLLITILYAVGILSTVFHFSNGLWTMGITWGLWTSPAAMRRANLISVFVGVLLGGAGLGALGGMRNVNVEQARQIETRMEDVKRMLEGGGALPSEGGRPQQSSPSVRLEHTPEPTDPVVIPASVPAVKPPAGS
jgi:succinate dehydrogenase / fumarate reductase cytochrome b subunit